MMVPGWLVRNQGCYYNDQNRSDDTDDRAGRKIIANALHRAHNIGRHLHEQKRPEKCPKQAHLVSSYLRIISSLILSQFVHLGIYPDVFFRRAYRILYNYVSPNKGEWKRWQDNNGFSNLMGNGASFTCRSARTGLPFF